MDHVGKKSTFWSSGQNEIQKPARWPLPDPGKKLKIVRKGR